MEEAEIHHDRPALSGVIRELEAQPNIDRFLGTKHPHATKRLRQAVGVVVRIIMEQRASGPTSWQGAVGPKFPGAYSLTETGFAVMRDDD